MVSRVIDTNKPTNYTENKGGIVWQRYCVNVVVSTLRQKGLMLSGVLCVRNLKVKIGFKDTRKGIQENALIVGKRLCEGLLDVENVITRLALVTFVGRKTQIGKVVNHAIVGMSMLGQKKSVGETIHIGQSIYLYGKKQTVRCLRDGLYITSMGLKMIIESLTFRQCQKITIIRGSLLNLTKKELGNLNNK